MNYPYVDKEKGWLYFNEETIIVNDDIKMRWHHSNKQHYTVLGYNYTNWKDMFSVDVQHLSKGSHVKVKAICPRCEYQREVMFKDLMRYTHSKCKNCSHFIDRTGNVYEYCEILKYDSQNKQGKSIYKCLCYCGEIFYTLGSSLENGHTTSCGCRNREIVSKMMSERIGDKNGSWNPDLTHRERNSKRSAEDQDWAYKIKDLDNFTCQCCSHHGGVLASHHLNGYKDHPEERLDLDNGVSLCKPCHDEFHWDYMGTNKKKCTRQDFVIFCEEFYPDCPFLSQ